MRKKKNMSKILLVGDVHGRFSGLNEIIDREKPDLTICLGEFGFWANLMPAIWTLHSKNPIWFIDGNHEQFTLLNERKSDEIVPNVFYKPRGSVENIAGKNFLFLGGGFSIDWKYRTPGYDYFPDDELLKMSELDNIPKRIKIDVVCSHTAPNKFSILGPVQESMYPDSSRNVLDYVLKKYKPREWFFAHFHILKEGCYAHKDGKYTSYTCLNMIPNQNCYRKVEL